MWPSCAHSARLGQVTPTPPCSGRNDFNSRSWIARCRPQSQSAASPSAPAHHPASFDVSTRTARGRPSSGGACAPTLPTCGTIPGATADFWPPTARCPPARPRRWGLGDRTGSRPRSRSRLLRLLPLSHWPFAPALPYSRSRWPFASAPDPVSSLAFGAVQPSDLKQRTWSPAAASPRLLAPPRFCGPAPVRLASDSGLWVCRQAPVPSCLGSLPADPGPSSASARWSAASLESDRIRLRHWAARLPPTAGDLA